jgi:hypothetical protein
MRRGAERTTVVGGEGTALRRGMLRDGEEARRRRAAPHVRFTAANEI